MLLMLPACSGKSNADGQPTATGSSSTESIQLDDATSTPEPTPTNPPLPTAVPTPEFVLEEGILISEVFAAEDGSAFVEMYNAGEAAVDLAGHTLVYQKDDASELQTLYTWTRSAYMQPHGYYLLAREGFPVERLPDVTFEIELSPESGGLLLSDDALPLPESRFTWGNAPQELIVNSAAEPMVDGNSLERLPGGFQGNGRDSGDHGADIVQRAEPQPRNSGDPALPQLEEGISIEIDVPFEVAAGEEFSYLVRITNLSGKDLSDVVVSVPFDVEMTALTMPRGAVAEDGLLTWTIAELFVDASITEPIFVKAPYSQSTYTLGGGSVSAESIPLAIARIVSLNVGGGKVPIEAADNLLGQTITVEGVATMYSGGFWTQREGTQFYIQDASGGIKVHVPSESGQVSVVIGDNMRVTGLVRRYRGELELVPAAVAADVNKLRRAELPKPQLVMAGASVDSAELLGQVLEVEGVTTRVEAFPHWYEVDLAGDDGGVEFVRIDKQTNIRVDDVVVGERYRMVGIAQQIEADYLLLPRQQEDLVKVADPVIHLQYETPATIDLEATAVQTITLINDTAETLRSVIVAANIPRLPNDVWVGDVAAASGNGQAANDGKIYWGLGELSANGGSAVLTYTVGYLKGGRALAQVSVSAESLTEPIITENEIYIGASIPIGAIQGVGDQSPFADQIVTTPGIVSAVFPGLNAFWIQDGTPDETVASSEGLLVQVSGEVVLPAYGEQVEVTGLVRELRGQTTLLLGDFGRIESSGFVDDLYFFTPISLDPPANAEDAAAYYEAFEGMVVAVDEQAVVVAPTNIDGETTFVLRSRLGDGVDSAENRGRLIVVDDGSTQRHYDASTAGLVYRRGDRVRQIVGVLSYTNDTYKIQPYAPYEYDSGIFRASSELPEVTAEGRLSVATFNVGDLFDRFPPHPGDIAQLSREQIAARLDKIASAILAMGGPSIIAIQEVESAALLEELVALDELTPFSYSVLLLEGNDDRGINNAFLLRDQLLTERSVRQFPEPSGLTMRHPLVLETDFDGQRLFVVNAQFGSAESHESRSDASLNLQADWLRDVVSQLRAEDGEAGIVVMGSFAAERGDAALETLISAELQHAFDKLPVDAPDPYTVIEDGELKAVDHVLISADLFDRVVAVDNLHINADFPIIDYSDPSAARSSDHDPIVVTFE